jgi:hypothetical protein
VTDVESQQGARYTSNNDLSITYCENIMESQISRGDHGLPVEAHLGFVRGTKNPKTFVALDPGSRPLTDARHRNVSAFAAN